MKKKVLILSIIVFSILGFYFFIQSNFKNSSVSSSLNKKLESKWNGTKNISRINDSNEEILFKNIDILVTYKGKKIGDTNTKNPLIIDLSDDNIKINNSLFSKSCNADFTKKIKQSFKSNTALTSIKTNVTGKIIYTVTYEINGYTNAAEAEETFINLIMKDIYTNAKSSIKFGIPEIKPVKLPNQKEVKLKPKSLIKL
ncbi:hypothetical protein [uncultured Polaribacter sp.]|uniref:hypothetical protein n=1 Tax=uncultured Polaribacter sp. TaxID=174711 RepID=UPI002636B31A|nr:hypothetical protein [uncultured Polaribacter sp.]